MAIGGEAWLPERRSGDHDWLGDGAEVPWWTCRIRLREGSEKGLDNVFSLDVLRFSLDFRRFRSIFGSRKRSSEP